MHGILLLFFIILLLVILGIIIYVLYEFVHKKIKSDYNKLVEKSDVSKIVRYSKCPEGCDKGMCVSEEYCSITDMLKSNCCGFDFQCQHCLNLDGQYYKFPDNYYQYKIQQTNLKNNKIKMQTKEIDEINKAIRSINNT